MSPSCPLGAETQALLYPSQYLLISGAQGDRIWSDLSAGQQAIYSHLEEGGRRCLSTHHKYTLKNVASGHNPFSVTKKPTQLDCAFEIYMVEIPLPMFGGKSPTPR